MYTVERRLSINEINRFTRITSEYAYSIGSRDYGIREYRYKWPVKNDRVRIIYERAVFRAVFVISSGRW